MNSQPPPGYCIQMPGNQMCFICKLLQRWSCICKVILTALADGLFCLQQYKQCKLVILVAAVRPNAWLSSLVAACQLNVKLWCRRDTKSVWQFILYFDLYERHEPQLPSSVDGGSTPLLQVMHILLELCIASMLCGAIPNAHICSQQLSLLPINLPITPYSLGWGARYNSKMCMKLSTVLVDKPRCK